LNSSLATYLVAAGAVTLAEMGDKTQLLAMAFAAKYKAWQVLWGVFVATVFNHALAVAVGNCLTRFQAAELWIEGLAALSFIFFGLWTSRGDCPDGEEKRSTKYGAVLTVTIAFFLAELGDKTQLATIALAAKFSASPMAILMGTTTGMLIADGVGIWLGVVACKRIPERTVKLISAAAFMVFGYISTYQVATERLKLALPVVGAILLGIVVISGIAAVYLLKTGPNADAIECCAAREGQPK
jgi:putative Ca2+/H+ antiporter (TMEM165/GDT1 family)